MSAPGRVSVDQIIANFIEDTQIKEVSEVRDALIRWAYDAELFIASTDTFVKKECELVLSSYRAKLPSDFYELVAIKVGNDYYNMLNEGFSMYNKAGTNMAKTGNSFDDSVIGYYNGEINNPGGSGKTGFNIVNGYLQFKSKETGKIGIAYMGVPIGDDGYPLIREGHQPAIVAYLMWKYYVPQWLDGRMPTDRYQLLEKRWKELCSQARGVDNLPSEPQMQRLRMIWNSMYPKPHKNQL